MISFLTTRAGTLPLNTWREKGGEHLPRVEMLFYEDLRPDDRYPPGLYVFTDFERMSAATRKHAVTLRTRLEGDRGCICLNDPRTWIDRMALHRLLRERGVNDFETFGLEALFRGLRFPAFVRHRDAHTGAFGPLVHSRRQLGARILKTALRRRVPPWDLVATEFTDTADRDGIYRKFSAFRVGPRVIPRHVFFSRDWMVKQGDLSDPEQLAEEVRYLREDPHADLLRPVFDLAHVEWGRIDYSMSGDRIRVWEINTNPMVVPLGEWGARAEVHSLFLSRLRSALEALQPPVTTESQT